VYSDWNESEGINIRVYLQSSGDSVVNVKLEFR